MFDVRTLGKTKQKTKQISKGGTPFPSWKTGATQSSFRLASFWPCDRFISQNMSLLGMTGYNDEHLFRPK